MNPLGSVFSSLDSVMLCLEYSLKYRGEGLEESQGLDGQGRRVVCGIKWIFPARSTVFGSPRLKGCVRLGQSREQEVARPPLCGQLSPIRRAWKWERIGRDWQPAHIHHGL